MIRKIRIRNFKSIIELDLRLDQINVLIGGNGAGKSNVISFFKLLRSIKSNTLNSYISQQGYMDYIFHLGRETGDNSMTGLVEFAEEVVMPSTFYQFTLHADAGGRAIIQSEVTGQKVGFWEKERIGVYNEKSFVFNKSEKKRDVFLSNLFDEFKIYHFHDTSYGSPLKKISPIHDNEYLRENGENLPAFLYYLKKKHPKSLKRIEKVVGSIAPFFESFNLKPDRINEEFIRLEWKEIGFNRYQNAQSLSDGTLRFIALATLMLQPAPPKTIIIDEPELGLHPSAINKLAGLVRMLSAKSQVILSTQSTDLINNFDADNVITVDKKNGASKFKHLSSSELDIWLEDYSLGDLWLKSVIGGQP